MQSVPTKLFFGAMLGSEEYNDQHITIMGTSVSTFNSTKFMCFEIVQIMYF